MYTIRLNKYINDIPVMQRIFKHQSADDVRFYARLISTTIVNHNKSIIDEFMMNINHYSKYEFKQVHDTVTFKLTVIKTNTNENR